MKGLKNIHPGEVLMEEFLLPFNITAYRLSKDIDIPQTRISEIVKGNRRITADTALRLSKYLGTSAKFWLGLQDDYDLEEESITNKPIFENIKTTGEQFYAPEYSIKMIRNGILQDLFFNFVYQ